MRLVQVYGMGCPRCNELAANVRKAAEQLGLEIKLEKITDLQRMAMMGVMAPPALGIDGMVVSTGKVHTVEELKSMLAG